MSANQKYPGICSTCNHAPYCVNLQRSKRPIWFCDMFDDYTPPDKASQRYQKQSNLRTKSKKENNYAQYKGLCMNCAKRESCTFPKPEGGVWHCAEYI